MVDLALANLAPEVGPGNDTTADELACLEGTSQLEAFALGEVIDDTLDCLDPRHALIIRRRWALGPDWPTIAQEMRYHGARQARRAYRLAMRRFVALYAAVAAPSDSNWMKKGEPPPSRHHQ